MALVLQVPLQNQHDSNIDTLCRADLVAILKLELTYVRSRQCVCAEMCEMSKEPPRVAPLGFSWLSGFAKSELEPRY